MDLIDDFIILIYSYFSCNCSPFFVVGSTFLRIFEIRKNICFALDKEMRYRIYSCGRDLCCCKPNC